MPVRVPRLAAPSRPAKASFSRPSYRTLPRPSVAAGRAGAQASAAGTSSRCNHSSSSSAGRSSSRDGAPRVKQAPATAPRAASPTPAPLKQTKVALAQPDKLPAASSKHAFELLHVGRGLVGLDSFFALHRPLLELPLRPGTRRSAATQEMDSDYVPLQDEVDEVRMSRKGESELALVQDRADDGSLVGEPYFARLKQVEPFKSVEEELAAEAEEDAILAYKEEVQHQAEQQASEPYDAWLVGQHERLEPTVARYLATRPPHTEPPSPTASSSDPSSTRPEFAYLAPFNSSSTPDVKAETSFSHIFSPLFLSPLTPDESTRTADSFLRTCEMAYRWSARNDFISTIGERLRQASQAYGVAEAAKAAPASEEAVNERGATRVWDEQEGYRQVQAALGTHPNLFLPQEIVDLGEVTIEMDSVKRKRQKKIRKHKYKKRRKAQRALRKKLGK